MDNIYYFHGKTLDDNRFTIAATINKDDDAILGISICSDKDNFNKKMGRKIAAGRLTKYEKFISSSRGVQIHSVYTDKFSEFRTDNGGFPENYFKGQELKVLQTYIAKLNNLDKIELRKAFRL